MSDTNWTKGEWQIVSESNSDVVVGVRSDSGCGYYEVCEIDLWASDEGEGIANTHLIAAAPDLFEELEAVAILLTELMTNETNDSAADKIPEAVKQIDAVLAKARGETGDNE